MKTYEEMALSVMRRARAHKTVRNRWIVGTVAAVFAMCVGVSAATVIKKIDTATSQQLHTSPQTTKTANESLRVTFLYAEGDDATEMEQGVVLPCRSQLRVVDVSGMTDTEIEAIAQQEQAHADALVAAYPEAQGYSWIQYSASDTTPVASNDHLVATFVHAGHFVLKVRDWSQVESIQGSTRNSVLILTGFPRSEEVDPFAYPQSRRYYMNKTEMHQRFYHDGVEVSIGLGSGVVKYLNENPIPLSKLSETFTFTFNFIDGTQETCTVDMFFNDNGEVYALYRGTTAVA